MRYAGEVAGFDANRFYDERKDVRSAYDQQKGKGQDNSERARVDAMNKMYGTNHKDLGDFTPEQFGYWHTQHHSSEYKKLGKGGNYYSSNQSNGSGNSTQTHPCLLYTSPSPRDRTRSRMPSSA